MSGRSLLVAPVVVFASGCLAALVLGVTYDGLGPMPWTAAVAAAATLLIGGVGDPSAARVVATFQRSSDPD